MASAGVGLFLNSLRRALSGGILLELRSGLAIPEVRSSTNGSVCCLTSPRHAEANVAFHLFDRRVAPSFEEGLGCAILKNGPRSSAAQTGREADHAAPFVAQLRQAEAQARAAFMASLQQESFGHFAQ